MAGRYAGQERRGQSSYTLLTPDGTVAATGYFPYLAPHFLAPKAEGWVAGDGSDVTAKMTDLATIQVGIVASSADPPSAALGVTRLKVSGGGTGIPIKATGFVENGSSTLATLVEVTVILLDENGTPMGFIHVDLPDLGPGETHAWEAENFLNLSAAQVIETVGIASSAEH